MEEFYTDNMTIAGTETMQNTTSPSYEIGGVKAKLVYRYIDGILFARLEVEE